MPCLNGFIVKIGVELTLNGKSLGKGVSSKSGFPYIENAPLI